MEDLPKTEADLTDLHLDIGATHATALPDIIACVEVLLGHDAARAAVIHSVRAGSEVDLNRLDAVGPVAYMREVANDLGILDGPQLTVWWYDAASYALDGTAPRVPATHDIEERERRVRELVRLSGPLRRWDAAWADGRFGWICEGVRARAALDGLESNLSSEGVRVLSKLSESAFRVAQSREDRLAANPAGALRIEGARAWLKDRREFKPSRWRNPEDDQWAFDADQVASDAGDIVRVPQDADGVPFTPSHVVRMAKSGGGISITTGAKAFESRHGDFFDALLALAAMDVPRWRRRNRLGNWGIVRARGAWVAISRAEIERELRAVLAGDQP